MIAVPRGSCRLRKLFPLPAFSKPGQTTKVRSRASVHVAALHSWELGVTDISVTANARFAGKDSGELGWL
ncbi:hypothetical protein Mkiyose1088_17860 [Mycobacterium kiyosense]|nr:hypothetical protein IWGMT90018_18090 [Mycobacterium kiyosense]BDE13118.1 hypothetical protein MKCMC460_19780 [Mycobacterium sp. 20KCMC460]GLB89587.1 hypothetical protein SRL2020130_24040 [Mycobacterium kiyosense]GLC02320.1 hypothetical protein SRL2020400_29110 [Mycobacterium kiyosense]GLC13017.1 hypothetical protein SRL2020448_16200 [Mycobacterium kiyosense]